MGTWIEIPPFQACTCCKVVPHVGTWIEILVYVKVVIIYKVVPHVGTWIEMLYVK